MENRQRKQNPYLLLFPILTVAAVTMRTVASFTSLNKYGYYSGALFAVSAYLSAISVLLLMSYAVLYRKEEKKQASFGGAATYIPAAPLALCLVLLGASLFAKKRSVSPNGLQMSALAPLGSLMLKVLALLAFAGALYFLFAVLRETKRCDLHAIFGMALALFLILYAGYLYFDKELPLNAQTKICDQIAYVFASVFFLSETRISLGREKWPIYTACGFCAAFLCAYSAIPALLVYCFGGRVISNSTAELFVTFFLFVYILSRTVLSLFLNTESATPLMVALHEDAHRLSEEVASHGPLPFEPQPNAIKESDGDEETTNEDSSVEETEESDDQAEPAHAQEDNNEENSGN